MHYSLIRLSLKENKMCSANCQPEAESLTVACKYRIRRPIGLCVQVRVSFRSFTRTSAHAPIQLASSPSTGLYHCTQLSSQNGEDSATAKKRPETASN